MDYRKEMLANCFVLAIPLILVLTVCIYSIASGDWKHYKPMHRHCTCCTCMSESVSQNNSYNNSENVNEGINQSEETSDGSTAVFVLSSLLAGCIIIGGILIIYYKD